MLNIGMILDNSFPPDPRVANEAKVLIQAGHRVHLYCLDYTGGDLMHEEEYEGIHVVRYPASQRIRSLAALAYTVPFYHNSLWKSIADFIQKQQIEILHVHDMAIVPAVYRANKKPQLPIILDLHENRPEIMKFYAHVNTLQGKLLISPAKWKKVEFQQIKGADSLLVVTPEAREYYCQHVDVSSDKFVVLPNTVHNTFYKEAIEVPDIAERFKDRFNLLYVGETGLRRGLMTALKALPLLIKEIPQINILIVGKSVTDHVLKDYVRQHQLEEYVTFEGWQDVKKFPAYIQASQIGISPLHRNIHHDTTYANKIFQYLSFGCPILVSGATAQANIAFQQACGLVHEAENFEDFAAKTLELFRRPEEREKMGENGKSFVRNHFTWSQTAKELEELYRTWEEKLKE